MLILFGPLILIWYFLIMRPQRQQQQQLQEIIANLKAGDEVVTNGGVIGKIKEVKDSSLIIHSAEKSFIEISKSAVVGKRPQQSS